MKLYPYLLVMAIASLLPGNHALAQGTDNARRVPPTTRSEFHATFGSHILRGGVPSEEAKRRSARIRALVSEGETLLRSGRLPEAEATCKQALAAAPNWNGQPFCPEARRLLGEIYLAEGRNSEAIACFSSGRQ